MNRWKSFEEYKDWVDPSFVDRPGPWRRTQRDCLLENVMQMTKYLEKVSDELAELEERVGRWKEEQISEADFLHQARNLAISIVCDAEHLFLYTPELVKSDYSYDFLHEKELYDKWDGYKSSPRLLEAVEEFAQSTQQVITGFYKIRSTVEEFIIDSTEDLPDKLNADFRTARDLFSVDMEEAGAFFAGRGLEGVLREIARALKLRVEHKGKQIPLHEMDLADVAEAFRRARWKKNGHPVIDRKVKALLDLLRAARNATAHRSKKAADQHENPDWREIAKLSAKTANAIWLTSGKGRKKLTTTIIVRDW